MAKDTIAREVCSIANDSNQVPRWMDHPPDVSHGVLVPSPAHACIAPHTKQFCKFLQHCRFHRRIECR